MEILQGYRQLMRDFGVTDYILQATTAVREAQNQQFFLDQVQIKTGFQIEVVNMSQEIYTKLASLVRTIGVEDEQSLPRDGILLADISSGGLGRPAEKLEIQVPAEPPCGAGANEGTVYPERAVQQSF